MESVRRNPLEGTIVMVCSIVLWVTTVVIFVILTANTVLRYTGGTGLQWANELPEPGQGPAVGEATFRNLRMSGNAQDVRNTTTTFKINIE